MLTTMTELDAINQILSAIGSDPVTSLEDSTDIDVINARRLLNTVSRNVQRKGWNFNEVTRTFQPGSSTHEIAWDDTIISLKATDGNTYVKRGKLLYDITNDTNQFTRAVTAEVIYGVEFEDLPDCFKNYVTASTAIDFQARYFGDAAVAQDLQFRMQEAYNDIVEYDMLMSNTNMLQIPGVASALART